MLFFSALGNDLVDEGDDLFIYLVSLKDGFDHRILGNLVGSGFDHDDLFPGGSHGQGQIGNLLLRRSGVDDELTVDEAHLGGGAGTVKGNIGNAGGNGRAQHCGQLRAALRIHRHNDVVKGHVVSVILGEQRTHGAVDDTGSKDCVLRRLSFSLCKTSRDLSDCV